MSYERPRLLLVQRDKETSAIIGYRLQLLGYDVECLSSGEEVGSSIDRTVPHLAIVEKRLPGIDGLEVSTRLRSDKRSANVPILLCSQDSSNDSVRNAFLAGANDYLLMPFDPATLESKVEALLASDELVKVWS